ncbi:MAG TPA: hypothetical protein VFV33_03920, partial [Gemmatimonadaceae bacterium]|nr:hypothetical protein [Gemmatimonadaceae bacterium]
SIREWLTIPAVFACLVAGAGVGALSRNGIELVRLRAEVESLTASAGQILDARTEAESTVQGIEALLALRPAARPARLAASLVGALEGQDWTLRNLALEESGQMVATLELASVDPAALVRTLEGTGEFVDATVEILPNSTQVVLRARAKGGPSGTPIVGEGP